MCRTDQGSSEIGEKIGSSPDYSTNISIYYKIKYNIVVGLSLWISDEGCGSCDLAQGYIYGVSASLGAPPHFSCKSTHLYQKPL